jgi:RND family efflux transporter MFP subunit
MAKAVIHLLVLALLLAACRAQESAPAATKPPLWVKTQAVEASPAFTLDTYSGIVKAHKESRLSSEVQARILERRTVPGSLVREGDILFLLDTRDLDQVVNAARAGMAAAEAERDIASADLRRWEQLMTKNAASAQSFDQAQRTHRASTAHMEAANAQLKLAARRLDHAVIRAPFDGLITAVHAEVGQVALRGEALASVADQLPREIEVHLPDFVTAPKTAVAYANKKAPVTVALAEVSGALEAGSNTWRARYRLPPENALALGSVVRLQLVMQEIPQPVFRVPIAAIDERGAGPSVWRIDAGRAQPASVTLVSLAGEAAIISGDLAPDTRVIAVGTHLLSSGIAVQELAP